MGMKYKTFRNIVLAIGLTVILLAGYGLSLILKSRQEAENAKRRAAEAERRLHERDHPAPQPTNAGPATDPPVAPGGATAPAGAGLSPLQRATLERALAGISGDKLKDGVPGHAPAKVNLYADGGAPGQVNRLKIDLDGNGKWDEKWTFEVPGQSARVKRQVASQDDEQYDREYLLVDGAWKPTGGTDVVEAPPPPAALPEGAKAGDEPLRAMDQRLLEKIRAGISGAKEKDPWPQSWKVNLYSDTKDGVVNRAKVDLDRDEKSDEKWTIEREGGELKVKRQVSSGDDDTLYDKEFRLDGDRWRLKR
ncbi:MAG: hypothetical protein AB7N76_29835 [Planctomycetota bacterium]